MKRALRTLALAGAGGLVLGGAAALLLWRGSGPGTRRPRPLAPELRDLGFACLATGTVQPPLAELGDDELSALAEILGRLIGAYERGDFDSFLALRIQDLDFAARARAEDLEALRDLARSLSVSPAELEGDWVAVLARFWDAYYSGRPAVARFLPESARIELHEEGLGARSLEAWDESFLALRDRTRGPWIRHQLAVPHARSLERIAADSGPLAWLDLELSFETHDGRLARLVTRFVWDGAERAWFLHDAATVYTEGDRSERHLIL